MAKSILFGALGAILVVAIVVGVADDLTNRKVGSDIDFPTGGDAGSLATSSKSIYAHCAPTDFPDLCESTLNSSSINGHASVKDAIVLSVRALAQQVQTSFNLSISLGRAAKDPMNQQAIANCKDLFADAASNIQTVAAANGISNPTQDQVNDALTIISAVTAYATSCVEDISDPELKKTMDDGLVALYQLSSNALTIITNLRDILQPIAFRSQPPNGGRRLLAKEGDLYDRDSQGYPTWLTARDRKLLGTGRAKPSFKPNVVVAQDGSGQFKSIQAALDAMPKNFPGRYTIYVKAGVYKQYVTVNKNNVNVLMYGDGSRKTIVTGSKNFADHTPTFNTAPFTVVGTGFICMFMGFSNTAGPKGYQAVALRVTGDRAVFYQCRMDGYQDTLYVHAMRQFYRNCVISGTIDFIFGDATVVIQNSLILVRRPDPNQFNAVTASGRTARDSSTGIVLHNCRILPDRELFPMRLQVKTYLGRPWKTFARAIFMESVLGDVIQPVGYTAWDEKTQVDKVYYAEYGNRGPGAATGARVNWAGFHVLNRVQAREFTVASFLDQPRWLQGSGVRYIAGLRQ